jgi:hypothetical protein
MKHRRLKPEEKAKIIERLTAGEKVIVLAMDYGLSEAGVYAIRKKHVRKSP